MNAIRKVMSQATDAELEAAWSEIEAWEKSGSVPETSVVRVLFARCPLGEDAMLGTFAQFLMGEVWREVAVRAKAAASVAAAPRRTVGW